MSCSRTQCTDAGEARPPTPRSRVKHSTTEPLRSPHSNALLRLYTVKIFVSSKIVDLQPICHPTECDVIYVKYLHRYILSQIFNVIQSDVALQEIMMTQSELPQPIPRNSAESNHGCTLRIYFHNAGDNVTLTLYNMTLTTQKPC